MTVSLSKTSDISPANRALDDIKFALDALSTLIPFMVGERVTVTLPESWAGFGGLTFEGVVDRYNRKPSDPTGKSLSIRTDKGSRLPARFIGVSPLDVRVLA